MRCLCNYLILSLLLCLAGCIPYSDNPLTGPNDQTVDSNIYGTWFWTEEKEAGYIHIGVDRKAKLLRVIMTEMYKDGELSITEFSGHTSSVSGCQYMNLRWVNPVDENPGYMFVKYELRENSLGISLMNTETVEKAIREGVLQGVIGENDQPSSVHITEEQKRLEQFVGKNDKDLFKEMTYLQKLKLPPKTQAP